MKCMDSGSRITYTDIAWLRDKAVREFVSAPSRVRLADMIVDLDQQDVVVLAHLTAAVSLLNRLGCINQDKLKAIMPSMVTADQYSVWNDE